MTDYANRGIQIIQYLRRHGVISFNGFGIFPQHHLEMIAKIGAGEEEDKSLLLAHELAHACRNIIQRSDRGAKKYKLGSYWFSALGENGLPTTRKSVAHGIDFPDLGLRLKFGLPDQNDEEWHWVEYNDESAMILLIDNPKLFKKPSYRIKK